MQTIQENFEALNHDEAAGAWEMLSRLLPIADLSEEALSMNLKDYAVTEPELLRTK